MLLRGWLRVALSFVALGSLSAFGLYTSRSYAIADDYSVRFDGRGAAGTFRGLTGTIVFDPNDLGAARMEVSVDAGTISTGNETKDRHARGEDWFDVARYPRISYRARAFAKTPTGYVAKGEFTLHGVTKAHDLPFTFVKTDSGGGVFVGETTVNREAHGIEGPWLGFTVADEIAVELRVGVE